MPSRSNLIAPEAARVAPAGPRLPIPCPACNELLAPRTCGSCGARRDFKRAPWV